MPVNTPDQIGPYRISAQIQDSEGVVAADLLYRIDGGVLQTLARLVWCFFFALGFGASVTDSQFDARLDFDGDDRIGFSDFLVFAGIFGCGVGFENKTLLGYSNLCLIFGV